MVSMDEIRSGFLDFFRERGHTVYPSDSLVPANDPSLLFTSAGMVQFKDMFLGSRRLAFRRATTCQKCLRAGDLDRVGTTNRHHSFFEMLGNFSFGDYFKKEAIAWAWEYLTRTLRLAPERLFPSVYLEDREALEIWRDMIRVPEGKISRFGEDYNFWPANAPSQGPNGPCGPCSEIYYDFGAEYGCGRPECAVGCDCDRYVEIWNLVFTQFDRKDGGRLEPLAKKNIDTGMGLERLAAVIQGVHSNFETAEFQELLGDAAQHLGVRPDVSNRSRLWRIADHARAVAFAMADGVGPSNEGRGYVVRRILRGAVRDSYLLGRRDLFLDLLLTKVISLWGKAYPELRERREKILADTRLEEERFRHTLESALELLNPLLSQKKNIDAGTAFKLHDTFGFPIELTRSMAKERGLTVDEEGFRKILDSSRERSRAATTKADIFGRGALAKLREKFPPSRFVGLETTRGRGAVLAIVKNEDLTDAASAGDQVTILLDETVFYGEAGGEVGDAGVLQGPRGRVEISDTHRPDGYFLHTGRVSQGEVRVGDSVETLVDQPRRLDIVRNHDATHLLQAALRRNLGNRVEQKGSLVRPEYLRFDFSHPQALTEDELRKVEKEVNEKILQDVSIEKLEVPISRAKEMGAIMFFDEKYGERVRVVRTADNYSIELCGGCHGSRTSAIGYFRILFEAAVAAGIRRIEAVTGIKAVERTQEDLKLLRETSWALGVSEKDAPGEAKRLRDKMRELERDLKRAPQDDPSEGMVEAAKAIEGERVVFQDFRQERKPDALRSLMDILIKKRNIGAAIVAARVEGKPFAIVGVRPDLVGKGLKAGTLARELGALSGGEGGGKDHMAQFGLSDESKIRPAFDEFHRRVTSALRGTFV